ncbi:MAG: hypothetical protein AB1635_20955, partial [Acidobacteriota bacterium]
LFQGEPGKGARHLFGAQELVDRAVAARGGLEALAGIRTLIADAETTMTAPQGRMQTRSRTYVEYPDRLRVEATVGSHEIVQVYADGRAWMRDPTGTYDAPPPMVDEFRAGVRRDLVALLRAAGARRLALAAEGEAGHEGRVLRIVSASGDDLAPVRLFIDPTSGAVVKLAYQSAGPDGPVATEEIFDDYRPVNGVSLPFKASLIRNGTTVLERVLTAVQLNPDLPRDTFSKPQ